MEYNRVSYQIDFFFGDRCIGTIHWIGSLEETRELASRIAIHLAADDFRIAEFNDDAPAGGDHRPTDKGRPGH
jgi:hypothetical protein